ncbi:hypothetical protein [Leisingera sp. MMG026]|uniref:hypothetical protein n=1 Tax=Leisingera sp. MMG026 TaxID=2909982 RepID=UPI001F17088B|nr:hypothetical protein [Leisingera sp. MMG026]MCF6429315.1 hypothetical protein [Leisingera sp. MMG026]
MPLALLVSGCMQYAPVEQPPVAVSYKAGLTAARVTGYTEPVMRTYFFELDEEERRQKVLSGNNRSSVTKRIEVTGAVCTLDSAEFSASFTTPAVVRLPKLKGRPTPLRVSCNAPGRTADTKVQPTLDGVIVAGGSVAGLVAAAVTAGIAAGKDNWSFGGNDVPLWIELEE